MATSKHDRHAPYWALLMVILIGIGLSTIWFDGGPFWHGYVLDIMGPAWTYILIRGRFTAQGDNRWARFFTPQRTVFILVGLSFGIEGMQFSKLYEATFDPFDFLAYISLLVPLFSLDMVTWEA